MTNLFISILILFISNMDSFSNPDKFIDLKDAVKILEKNDESSKKLNYSLSNCHSLEQYISWEQRDSLHTPPKVYDLKNKYENIEELITCLDENLISFLFYGPAELDCKINFPVLKFKNRFLLKKSCPYFYGEYIIELIEPQKVTIALIYSIMDNPAHREIITLPSNW